MFRLCPVNNDILLLSIAKTNKVILDILLLLVCFICAQSSSSGLRSVQRRDQQFGGVSNFTNQGFGSSQIVLSSLGPSSATALGAGYGTSFTGLAFGNATSESAGESSGLGSVAGLAYYGSLAGASQSIGYSTGFGGISGFPGSTITTPGTSSSGKKKKSSSSGGTTITTLPNITGSTGGTAGGTSVGSLYGLGVFSYGATFGTFGGLSLGASGFPGSLSTGGAQATGEQESSGYAIGGGFSIGAIGNGFADFFASLGGGRN
jgi:hypothetical protein